MRYRTIDRRRFLRNTGHLGLVTLLSGCPGDDLPLGDCRIDKPGLLVPQSIRANTVDSPLAVDVHSHIFNGHDVPMEDYFIRASLHAPPPLDALLKLIISPVTGIIRLLAPSAQEEHEQLCDLIATQDTVVATAAATTEATIRSELVSDDQSFIREITPIANGEPFRTAYREAEAQQFDSLGVQAVRSTGDPIGEEEISAALQMPAFQAAIETQGSGISGVARIWPFLRRIASRRYHNAFRLLDLYGGAEAGPIDIFVVSTVDFDASLEPSTHSTSVNDQVRIMEGIAILSAGRILPFVGYDPRRDIAEDGRALVEVKDAITNRGHFGVKLYPPMGFAAYGNANSSADCDWPDDDQYGQKLDFRLGELYSWASQEGIPILAHSNESMGITESCQSNGGHQDWDAAFNAFPGLRICAGHFGGVDGSGNLLTARMNGFLDLMKKPEARNLFADLAYLPELFSADSPTGAALATRLNEASPYGRLSDQLVFGTDWYMVARHPSESAYANQAVDFLRRVGGDAMVSAVLGLNAARFLNLYDPTSPTPAGAPPDDFWSRNGITPHWRTKLRRSLESS